MLLLYKAFLFLYEVGIEISSFWNEKARKWRRGRAGQWVKLRTGLAPKKPGEQRFWIHCASLGEFEQGRPVIEGLRTEQPGCSIVLTFFSPSGYEIRKDYDGADFVCYLPMDGTKAASRFLNVVQPDCALFVKYEFWYYYLESLHRRGIPTILVSGAFRMKQPFFKWWGGFFRSMLRRFSVLTVQDESSLALLQSIGLQPVLTGDTRYDRVAEIAVEAKSFSLVEAFKGGGKILVAGSTWPEDEQVLHSLLATLPGDWKLIIAPHELDVAHLNSIANLFGNEMVFYSSLENATLARVLVIDNIGMLSSLYRYGEIAFVGGGFNRSGIHNVLEPAVFGLPVLMGPQYQKFSEAVALVEQGFAFPVADAAAANEMLAGLMRNDAARAALSARIKKYIRQQTGATAKILALLPTV